MMDIDFFKLFNDTYGHYKGDECLIMVAKALSEALLRPTDFVARYGGEEFVAILPDTAEDGAVIVAEKLRTSVEQLRIPHAKSTVLGYVTLSLGVGGFSPASEAPLSETVTLVDKALYEAKHKGRNRVCRLALMKEPH
jgi:diguanylate cyclase (GGDEF)-like protein